MSYCLQSFRKQYTGISDKANIFPGTFLHKLVHLFLLYLCTEKNTCCTLTVIIESVIILTTKDFPLIYNKKVLRMEDFK